jgi:predicted transcriptional regulator
MNRYEHRYAFRLDPATERSLQEIAQRTYQTKASIMRRYVQEGVAREAGIYAERGSTPKNSAYSLASV